MGVIVEVMQQCGPNCNQACKQRSKHHQYLNLFDKPEHDIWLVIAGQKYSSQGSCCYTWMIGLVSGGSAETPHKRFIEQQRALNGHNCELTVSLQLWQLCCYSSRVLRASANHRSYSVICNVPLSCQESTELPWKGMNAVTSSL